MVDEVKTGERPVIYFGGKDAFNLFQTYGFPFEMTFELLKERIE
jgi:alanyl-tRNA synthetase